MLLALLYQKEDFFVDKRPALAIDLDSFKPLGEVAYEALVKTGGNAGRVRHEIML